MKNKFRQIAKSKNYLNSVRQTLAASVIFFFFFGVVVVVYTRLTV